MAKRTDNNTDATPVIIASKFIDKAGSLKKHIDLLMNSTSRIEQQKTLKELTALAEHSEDDRQLSINLLCNMFLTINSKHPLKKTVTRLLLSMDGDDVIKAMSVQCVSLISECKDAESSNELEKESDALYSLTNCFNNFPPGVEALSRKIDLVFLFALKSFFKAMKALSSESDDNKHKIRTYIYNSSKFMVSLLNQCDLSKHMQAASLRLLLAALEIITDDQFPFNVRANCGILLVMAVVHSPEKEGEESTGGICNSLPKLDHLDGIMGEWLIRYKNHSASICIFSGILNTVPHEVICAERLNGVPAPIFIFHSLLENASKSTGRPLEIMEISRTFISLSRLLFNMEVTDIEVIFKAGLDYIWIHLDHFIDTVRHDTVQVLKNFIKIAVHHKEDGHTKLMQSILEYVSNILHSSNANYKSLTIISNETTCKYLLKEFPDLPEKLLNNLVNSSIAPQVCSTYEALMEQHSYEEPNIWIDMWVNQIIPLVHKSEGVSTQVYYQKIFTAAFKLNHNIIKLLSYAHHTFDNPNVLSILLSCIITARKNNTVIRFCSKNVQPTALWRGMLELDLLKILMCHQTSEIRLATLTLIVESPKTTEMYAKWDLRFLVRFLHYNITTQEPNVRQQISALYRKAFIRFKESRYVIQRNIKNIENKLKDGSDKDLEEALEFFNDQELHYKKFLQEMLNQELAKGLLSSANYPRKSLSLDLLLNLKNYVSPDEFTKLWTETEVESLYQCLEDSYETNIVMAMKLLSDLPASLIYTQDKDELREQINESVELASSIKPACTITAAYQLQIYMRHPLASDVLLEKLKVEKMVRSAAKKSVPLLLLKRLMDEIEKGLDVAKENVLVASKRAPIYGLIFCMRHVIQKEQLDVHYPEIVPRIIDLCGRVSNVASPIVNNSSPEGYMPTDNDVITDETVTSQMILVYAWRTVKEVSLLLGQLTFQNLREKEAISKKYLTQIADYFITLFMETKHRGAYEQAYFGFSKFCAQLWNSDSVCAEWPVKWLNTILDVIVGKSGEFNKICSTRRSAGLPFMIQALVTTEPASRNNESFHNCMKTLLEIAGDLSEQNVKAATHSINVLRALYKHNQLGELVTPYVAKGVMLSILGFSHSAWGVRNSSTLLFSALMMRMFGVQRTKDNEELSIKNRLSARVFFMRYPELYDFILQKLKELTTSETEGNVSLYPLLIILSRLYPSGDKSEMLQYLPFINSCLGSSIFKLRELAAQASISAIPIDEYISYISLLLKEVCKKIPGNLLHGKLLQLKLLLNNLLNQQYDLNVPELVKDSFWLVASPGASASHMASTIYMEVLILLITKFKQKCYGTKEFQKLAKIISTSYDKCGMTEVSTAKTKFEVTRVALYMQLFANTLDLPTFCREKFLKDLLLSAVHSSNESIQIFALNCIYLLYESGFSTKYNFYAVQTDEDEVLELEQNLIRPLSDEMKLIIISAITADLGCNNLFTDLFHLFKTRRKEYSMKVCAILPFFPCIINRIRPKNVPVILEKQVILDFLISECVRSDSDMFCVILPIIGMLVFDAKQKLDYSPLVHYVLKPFSGPENTVEERQTICNFLVQNSRFLHDQELLSVKDIVEIWYIIYALLQDQELVVRDSISKITNFLQCPTSPFVGRFILGIYVVSENSLMELLHYMPELIPEDEAMKIYLSLALPSANYGTKCCGCGTESEVFIKGDVNNYEESGIMAATATARLKAWLWKLDQNLKYEDKTIFIEEHSLIAATRLYNLFYEYRPSPYSPEDKLWGLLVVDEAIKFLESRTIGTPNFIHDFQQFVNSKFTSFNKKYENLLKYHRVQELLKNFFSFDSTTLCKCC